MLKKMVAMHRLILPVALLLTVVLPMAEAKETSAPTQDYLQIGQETVALLNELTGVLETVKDKESADAAVSRVQEIAAKMQELRSRAEALPAPDNEDEAALREKLNNGEVRGAIHRFMVAMLDLAQTDAYGSEELINALTRMVGGQM